MAFTHPLIACPSPHLVAFLLREDLALCALRANPWMGCILEELFQKDVDLGVTNGLVWRTHDREPILSHLQVMAQWLCRVSQTSSAAPVHLMCAWGHHRLRPHNGTTNPPVAAWCVRREAPVIGCSREALTVHLRERHAIRRSLA